MTIQAQAATMLTLCEDKLARAEVSARGFELVTRCLGPAVAAWAYADAGDGPGQRRRSSAMEALIVPGRSWATVLAGPPGCGKTIAAARFVADRGGFLVHATSADRWPYAATAKLEPLLVAPWLLLDDLGDESTSRASQQLRALLSERYNRGARTVITTTLLGAVAPTDPMFAETIRGRYGDNAWSRLRPHFVGLGACQDLRGGDDPSTRGLERARRLAEAGGRLRAIARRGVDGPESTAVLEAFAEVAGVDLDGSEFDAALAAEVARRDAMSELAQQTTQKFAPLPNAETEVTTDSLAWLDSMEISP